MNCTKALHIYKDLSYYKVLNPEVASLNDMLLCESV